MTIIVLAIVATLSVTQVVSAQAPSGFIDAEWTTDWTRHSVPLTEIEMNLRKDAIPAINNPEFVQQSVAAAWMDRHEPILAVSIDGVTRGYPLQILIWHEMVNDVLNGIPLLVTFCPLCYSALIFDRRVNGVELQFGVSGALRHSDMIMYDAESNSLWQQISGEAIVGTRTGQILSAIPAQIISFDEFRIAWPDGTVLSRDTGYDRRYGQNPYPGYDSVDDRPWLYKGPVDGRLKPMQKVVAVSIGTSHKAYSHKDTKSEGAINDQLGGRSIVVFHSKRGARSALDKKQIESSKFLGSTGVYDRQLEDGRTLTFTRDGDVFKDDQTGSAWDISGMSIRGELTGTKLTQVAHGDIKTDACRVKYPGSDVYQADD